MRKSTQILMLSAFVLTALLSSCGEKQQQQESVVKFKTTKVSKKDVTLESKYSATIRGRQDIEVYPQVSGTDRKSVV